MKFVLIFYSAYAAAAPEDKADSPETGRERIDFDKVAAYLANAKSEVKGDTSLFVREAEAFDGVLEVHKDELPLRVVLLGDGPAMDRVREAYEAVDIDVTVDDLDNIKPEDGGASEDDGDPFDGNMVALKERATELGISFSPQIGYNNLLTRVQEKEKQDEQSNQG